MFKLPSLYIPKLWFWKGGSLKMTEFTHIDRNGNAHMVDVSAKKETERLAIAVGEITMSDECLKMVKQGRHKKGDVLTVAQVAGVMGAKKTSEMIPMTHNINLSHVKVTFESTEHGFICRSEVKCTGQTGVEMEALQSVSTALLTIYDMCKSIDKKMVIKNIQLLEKHGGKSGDFYF